LWQQDAIKTYGGVVMMHDKPEEEPSIGSAKDHSEGVPLALPVGEPVNDVPMAIPLALPVEIPEALPVEIQEPSAEPIPVAVPVPESEVSQAKSKTPCPICGAARLNDESSCQDCGYYFTAKDNVEDIESQAGAQVVQQGAQLNQVFADRFHVVGLARQIGNVFVFDGVEKDGANLVGDVWIYSQAPMASNATQGAGHAMVMGFSGQPVANDEFLPTFDDAVLGNPAQAVTRELPPMLLWPNIGWLRSTLDGADNPGLPKVLAAGTSEDNHFLVLEKPQGRNLWEIWDDESLSYPQKFECLQSLAKILKSIHSCNAFMEFVRPESVVMNSDGKIRFRDVLDILPLPLHPGGPVRGTLYTPPELISGKGCVSASVSMYSFGALLYSLEILHRELSEVDFQSPGVPKPFLPQFPDINPAFGRLISKTFVQEPFQRFPTDDGARTDSTGFDELIQTLDSVGRQMDMVRLEIASWTNTGMVRSGNEDAFALLHASESRQDEISDSALLLVADGMGGYEAGEVAAAITMDVLRECLSTQKAFAHLFGKSRFDFGSENSGEKAGEHHMQRSNPEECSEIIRQALRTANERVYGAARQPGAQRRGMGCTAEAVYIDGKNLLVGHVGDSRVYHYRAGSLVQVTRDHTLVNRLVELGTISAEEAETHPRRNELQQAIGGQPQVEVSLYKANLSIGDWVLVCSDGLTNHVNNKDLSYMLSMEAQSAQMAARRLVNLANIHGATDNATVVVIRCT